MHHTANYQQTVALNHAPSSEGAEVHKRDFRCEGLGASSEYYVHCKPADNPLRDPLTQRTSINSTTDYSSVKSGFHFAFDATNLRGTLERRPKDTPSCSNNSPVPPTRYENSIARYDNSIARPDQMNQNPEQRKIKHGGSTDRVPVQNDVYCRREKLSLTSASVSEDLMSIEKCNGYGNSKETPNHVFDRPSSQMSKPISFAQKNVTGMPISFDYNHRAVSKSSQASRTQERCVLKVPEKRELTDAGPTKKRQKNPRNLKPKLALKEIKDREMEIRSREMSRERTRCAMEKLFEEIRHLQVYHLSVACHPFTLGWILTPIRAQNADWLSAAIAPGPTD